MNLSRKISPIVFKFVQLSLNCRVINKNYGKKRYQIPVPYRDTILLSSALAFLWPIKKMSSPATKPVVEQSVSILEKADKLYDNGHYEECYKLLVAADDKQNVELQWRICRALYNMSKESKKDTKYKKELINQAYEIISNELVNHEDHFAVQKWYALLLDSKSSFEGIKERIIQLENVKKHMDLAVTLNPDDATILYMLGEWCYQITEMPWHQRKIAEILFASPPHSTYEDALEYFSRAEAAQPRFYSLNLLRLGSCYLKLEKDDQAKYYLKLAASYPAKSNDDLLANKEAAELLKKIQ